MTDKGRKATFRIVAVVEYEVDEATLLRDYETTPFAKGIDIDLENVREVPEDFFDPTLHRVTVSGDVIFDD